MELQKGKRKRRDNLSLDTLSASQLVAHSLRHTLCVLQLGEKRIWLAAKTRRPGQASKKHISFAAAKLN